MEKKILSAVCIATGHGTHRYDVKYQGEWGEWALINCMDRGLRSPTEEEYEKYNKDCYMNFGGYVEKKYTNDGITRAEVAVYYD